MELKANGDACFLRDISVQGSLKVRGADILPFSGPVGTIFPYAGTLSSLPENFLLCDGKELNKNDGFLDLFSAIGTNWGGLGTPFFNIPDLCGYFLRGSNKMDNVGKFQEEAIQRHRHDLNFNPTTESGYTSSTSFGGKNYFGMDCTTGSSNNLTGSFGTGAQIGKATRWNGNWNVECTEQSISQETRPKTALVYFIIKTKLFPAPTYKTSVLDDKTGLEIDEEGNITISGDLNVLSSLALNGQLIEELPIGSVLSFAGPLCKDNNFKICDGSWVTKDEFPGLQAAMGHAWGGTDEHFTLPLLHGYFLRGISSESERDPERDKRFSKFDGGNSGNKIGSYQEDSMVNHIHELKFKSADPYKKATFGWVNFIGINLTTGYADELTDSFGTGESRPDSSNKTDRWKAGFFVNCKDSGTDTETYPKNKWVNYIIKVRNTLSQKIKDSNVFSNVGFSIDGKGNTTFSGNVNLLGSIKIKGSLITMFPIGCILSYAGPCEKPEQIPKGFLLCNGNSISTIEFFGLYSNIGGSWGENKDKKEFNLPDFRGRFLRGVEKQTQKLGSYLDDSLKAHKHDVSVDVMDWAGFTKDAIDGGTNTGALKATTNYSNWERGYFGTGGPRPKQMYEKEVQQENVFYKEWKVGWNVTCSDPKSAKTSNETRCINAYINYLIKY